MERIFGTLLNLATLQKCKTKQKSAFQRWMKTFSRSFMADVIFSKFVTIVFNSDDCRIVSTKAISENSELLKAEQNIASRQVRCED